ncbi:MAG: ParA family protein [Candidatus Omnitrophica bacterium]|nr:ParA family protein [Candidatus Omnitrophota bacterium]
MGQVFSLCNQKGGVGKTTTAVNLAAALGMCGKKVLVVDVDPQGNATSGLGLNKSEIGAGAYELLSGEIEVSEVVVPTCVTNVFLIPSNSHLAGAEIELIQHDSREYILRSVLERVCGEYDFILVDCPPSLGLLTLNALVASDQMIIPLQCEYYALEGLGQLIQTYQLVRDKLNPKLQISGVILTMADFRTNLTQQVIEDVRNHFQDKVFKTVIPRSVKISEAPSFGKPIALYDPHSRGAKCYEEIAREFLSRFSAAGSGLRQDTESEIASAPRALPHGRSGS